MRRITLGAAAWAVAVLNLGAAVAAEVNVPWRCLVSCEDEVGEGAYRSTLYAVDLAREGDTELLRFDGIRVWAVASDMAGGTVVFGGAERGDDEGVVKFYRLRFPGGEPEQIYEERLALKEYDGPGVFLTYDGLYYALPYVEVLYDAGEDVFYFGVQGGERGPEGRYWVRHWTRFFRYEPATGDVEEYLEAPCHAFLQRNAEGEAPFYYTQDPTGYDDRLAFGRFDYEAGEMITLGYRPRLDNPDCPYGPYEPVADDPGPLYYVADCSRRGEILASHVYVPDPEAAGGYREVTVPSAVPSGVRYSVSRRAVVSLAADAGAEKPSLIIQDGEGNVVGEVPLPEGDRDRDPFAYDLL